MTQSTTYEKLVQVFNRFEKLDTLWYKGGHVYLYRVAGSKKVKRNEVHKLKPKPKKETKKE